MVDETELPEEAARWLADPARLADLQQRAASLGRRDGAAAVAMHTLELAHARVPEWAGEARERAR